MRAINSTAEKERPTACFRGRKIRERGESRESAAKRSRAKTTVLLLVFLLAVPLFLAFPKKTTSFVRDGLFLCVKSVIPAVFPFLVINQILVCLKIDILLGKVFGKITERLFHLSGGCAVPIILGAVCGFPTGAKTASELYRAGRISKEEAETVIAFSNNASPAFLIAGVGATMLSRADIGALLYIIQLVSSFFTGFLLCPRASDALKENRKKIPEAPGKRTYEKPCKAWEEDKTGQFSFSELSDAVANASGALIPICGSVVFFSVLSGFLLSCDFVPAALRVLLCSVFEITTGIGAASLLFKGEEAVLLIAFAVGFSGLSVLMQISSVIGGELNLKKYCIARVFSSFLCVLLAFCCRGLI